MSLFFTLFLLLMCCVMDSSFVWAVDIPYEKCTWKNRDFTDRLVNEAGDFETEADSPCTSCAPRKTANNTGSADDNTVIKPSKEATSKSVPPECFFASAVRSMQKEPGYIPSKERPKASTNYYHCNSMKDQKARKWASPVQPDGKKENIFPQPPCLNEDYIMMTYHSFHNVADCFGFDGEDKKKLFQLFNHESKFILNQKSDTGARCYTQVVGCTLEEVNKQIYVSNVSDSPKSQIYKDFRDKCPGLLDQVRIPDQIRSGSTEGKKGVTSKSDMFDEDYKGVKTAARKMNCAVTQNADTCFFYGMYNMKLNQIQFQQTMSRNSSPFPANVETESNTPASQRLRQVIKDFKLPLKLNEMLIVRGPVTKHGVREDKTWLMRSDGEIYDALHDENGKRDVTYNRKDLKIQKVTVFDMDDKETQWDLLYQAYNGGISVVSSEHLRGFIKDEKYYMSLGKHCREDQTMRDCRKICKESPKSGDCGNCKNNRHFSACQNRKILMAGRTKLPFDVKKFGRAEKLKLQARKFPSQIRRDRDYLSDKGAGLGNPTPLTNHLEKLAKRGAGDKSGSADSTIAEFVDFVKERCVF